jgi:4-oxalocrotonate tautomerase
VYFGTFIIGHFVKIKIYSSNVVYSFMPIVTVSLIGGRTQREKDRLAEAITESVCKILRVNKKEVVVVYQEAPHGNFYSEGVRL